MGGAWYGLQRLGVGSINSRSPHQALRFAAQSSPIAEPFVLAIRNRPQGRSQMATQQSSFLKGSYGSNS
ncbi:MAG: hypothetical protein ACREPR_03050 [Brasilonema sp.]